MSVLENTVWLLPGVCIGHTRGLPQCMMNVIDSFYSIPRSVFGVFFSSFLRSVGQLAFAAERFKDIQLLPKIIPGG